jgi:hypothetical protein
MAGDNKRKDVSSSPKWSMQLTNTNEKPQRSFVDIYK